jgi:hypothetical protein
MVDFDAELFQHFFELSIAERSRPDTSGRPQDQPAFELAAFELDHRIVSPKLILAIILKA